MPKTSQNRAWMLNLQQMILYIMEEHLKAVDHGPHSLRRMKHPYRCDRDMAGVGISRSEGEYEEKTKEIDSRSG